MRLLLQRVTRAQVRVDERVVGQIGPGLMCLVGIGHADESGVVRAFADKMVDLRIFRDEEGKTNRSLVDVAGAVLAISQFTLYADTRKGRRPSFLGAAEPDRAAELVEHRDAFDADRDQDREQHDEAEKNSEFGRGEGGS